ncbi:MAG TPA: glycoside hydrolase N-terminal domain-containing protein [Dyella sp.]|uniref:glycosyl hydrolase family 95 catalytic domain-containing protein n=1 Tax=Dyella sp. TaxID=1869338 RepID=UPI002CB1AB45|nr:glycoside hydrolase N-terminal domain-containing protein [Dyella sp.]HUB89655.1 glycoside hydrolase N-terminal domain-containing protein [Dyella sp.]
MKKLPGTGAKKDHGDLEHAARRHFLKMTGTMAALLPLLSAPGFAAATAPAQNPRRTRAPSMHGPTLWYATPASESNVIQEATPIGNGRMGGLIGGDPARDFLYLTDNSMWLGGPNDSLDNDGQFSYEVKNFGSFTMLAKLYIEASGHALSGITNYRRELDLANGYVRVSYRKDGIHYLREIFASHPDDVIVVHLSQSGGGTWSGAIDLQGTHAETTEFSQQTAGSHFSGALNNGLKYAAGVKAVSRSGSVSVENGRLRFAGCDALTILCCGGTNYTPDVAKGYMDHALDPLTLVRQKLETAASLTADVLLHSHIADYAALYDTMQVKLGASTPEQRGWDTWTRLQARAKPDAAADPELEAAYLQFGRYLTICGSRDKLPTTLQGLWLSDNTPDWMSDYHTDVNLQMNYWLPDRAGLPACFDALTNYCLSQFESWTAITRQHFNDPRNGFRNSSGKLAGWTVAISTNIFGGNGWWWHPAGSAWLCNSLWQHYQYTLHRDHLVRIYPLLKGACEFWEARLLTLRITDPVSGREREVLIDDSDWSPEQGPKNAKGITYAQELVWDLFNNYQQAAAILGVDAHYRSVIGGLQAKLYLPQVSSENGWLEEWMSPKNLGETRHRHLSPLIGFFPGDRITLDNSPATLIDGVTRLLDARGMTSYGWACAWRAICWARLKHAERAYQLVITNLAPWQIRGNGTAMNLFDVYQMTSTTGIFQIDANFGTPTAMLEMLLYSRPGSIELLPALPKAWAASGEVTGIGARDGFVVDMRWRDGEIASVTVHSVGGTRTQLKFGKHVRTISLQSGQSITITPAAG